MSARLRASALSLWWFVCFIVCIGLISATVADEQAPESGSDSETLTVFLVRHAEKVRGPDVGRDPTLTEAGRARAHALAHTLAHAGIDAIYTTEWRRTIETGAQLAQTLDIEPKVIRAEQGFIDKMRRILLEQKGRRVVVVGHSDTTPALARALGADDAPDIADNDFDDIYQVVISEQGTHFIHLRYGHPTP